MEVQSSVHSVSVSVSVSVSRVNVLICCDIILWPLSDWLIYVGKQMEQHSRQISRQSDEPQQSSSIPQSNTA